MTDQWEGTSVVEDYPEAETIAVVVTAGSTPYLERTLGSLAAQSWPPDVVLIVDVAGTHNGLGDGVPVEEVAASSGATDLCAVRVVHLPDCPTYSQAVSRGLEKYADIVAAGNRKRARRQDDTSSAVLTGPTGALSPITSRERARLGAIGRAPSTHSPSQPAVSQWLWLLHDDSAPRPDCLLNLLRAGANAPTVGMIGAKQVRWDAPDRLLEVGIRTTKSARRAIDIIDGELDQGQLDERSDILAVGVAGSLIRREVFEAVGGLSPYFSVFGDGLELSRIVRLEGYRVMVAPTAVIAHRQASYYGVRPVLNKEGVPTHTLEPDPDRSFRARRAAQLRAWVTFSSAPPQLLVAWITLLGVMRALWRLLMKSPGLAGDELAAVWQLLRSARPIRAGRRRLASHTGTSRSSFDRLYIKPVEIRNVRADRRRQEKERLERLAAPSELELNELAHLTRSRRRMLAVITVVTLLLAGGALSDIFTGRAITGGALTSMASSWRQLWDAAWSSWAATADGYPVPLMPLAAILALPMAVGSVLGLTPDMAMHVAALAAIPAAGLSAWFASGAVTRHVWWRLWAGLAWATGPMFLLGLGQGRMPAVLAHCALPLFAMALARAVGADRRDKVASGLVGVHTLTETERADIDRFEGASLDELSELADQHEASLGRDTSANGNTADAESSDESGTVESGTVDNGTAEKDAAQTDVAATAAHTLSESADDSAENAADDAAQSTDDAVQPAEETLVGREARRRAYEQALAAGAQRPLYGPGSATAAAVSGLIGSVIVAAQPLTALVMAVIALVLVLPQPRRRMRLWLMILPIGATAAPAWMAAIRQSVEAYAASHDVATTITALVRPLLTDAGTPLGVPAPTVWDSLAGMPLHLADLPLPLEQSAGSSPWPLWALALATGIGLIPLILAVPGSIIRGARGHAARCTLSVAVLGFALALLAARTIVAVGPSLTDPGSTLVAGWSGGYLSVMWLGLVATSLISMDSLGAWTSITRLHALTTGAHARRLRVLVARGLMVSFTVARVVAIAAAALSGIAWIWLGQQGAVGMMMLEPAGRSVPYIASDIQRSSEAGRVVRLQTVATPTGSTLEVSLWRDSTQTILDARPDVLTQQLSDRISPVSGAASTGSGSAEASGARTDAAEALRSPLLTTASGHAEQWRELSLTTGDAADTSLSEAVAAVTLGQEDAALTLARHGVAIIVLATHDDDLTAITRANLDSIPGLAQVATTDTTMAWRVSPDGVSGARAWIATSDGTRLPVDLGTAPDGGTITLPEPLSEDSTLVLAEREDTRWQARAEHDLPAVQGPDGWQQAFHVPAGTTRITVSYTDPAARTLLWALGITWSLTLLAALPLRRTRRAL